MTFQEWVDWLRAETGGGVHSTTSGGTTVLANPGGAELLKSMADGAAETVDVGAEVDSIMDELARELGITIVES